MYNSYITWDIRITLTDFSSYFLSLDIEKLHNINDLLKHLFIWKMKTEESNFFTINGCFNPGTKM